MIWMAISMTPRHLALYYIASFLPVRPHTGPNMPDFPQIELALQALSSRSPGRFPKPKCKRMTNLRIFALITNLELHFPPNVRYSSPCAFDDSAKEVTPL
jgi:hypothetical protein